MTYYSLEEAVECDMAGKHVFILCNERVRKSGGIGRYYVVFLTFKDFLKDRESYPHCHEILVDHKNNVPDPAGRLVFDFDIADKNSVPTNFTKQIEKTIRRVTQKYFTADIDINRFEYVWSTSPNESKFSKHLTVKNMYFDNWIELSKLFYEY